MSQEEKVPLLFELRTETWHGYALRMVISTVWDMKVVIELYRAHGVASGLFLDTQIHHLFHSLLDFVTCVFVENGCVVCPVHDPFLLLLRIHFRTEECVPVLEVSEDLDSCRCVVEASAFDLVAGMLGLHSRCHDHHT